MTVFSYQYVFSYKLLLLHYFSISLQRDRIREGPPVTGRRLQKQVIRPALMICDLTVIVFCQFQNIERLNEILILLFALMSVNEAEHLFIYA